MTLPPDYDWSASDEPPRDGAARGAGRGLVAMLTVAILTTIIITLLPERL